jgi:hypothetical protein
MGYPLDIDSYSDEQLQAALDTRKSIRQQGLCDYCYKSPLSAPCLQKERHRLAAEVYEKIKCKNCGEPDPERKHFIVGDQWMLSGYTCNKSE